MGAEGDKCAHFLPRPTCFSRVLKDDFDGGSQVIIREAVGNAAKMFKGFDMTHEEAFLALRWKHHREGSARKAQPHDEQLHFLAHAPDDRVGFAPVDLHISAWVIFQREEDIRRLCGLLVTAHIQADGCFAAFVTLSTNDLEHPMRGVALLAGELLVFLQQLPNTLFVSSKNRLELLTWWWADGLGGVGQGFADGNAVAAFFSCDLVNALLFDIVAPSNSLPVLFIHFSPPLSSMLRVDVNVNSKIRCRTFDTAPCRTV